MQDYASRVQYLLYNYLTYEDLSLYLKSRCSRVSLITYQQNPAVQIISVSKLREISSDS